MKYYQLPFVLFALLVVSGCSIPSSFVRFFPLKSHVDSDKIQLASYEETPSQKTIYVVGHGWHTGIVLKRSDVSTEILPEMETFADVDYVEFGWGDEGFYRAKKITPSLVFKAAFLPTPSVLHLAGFEGKVKRFYQMSDIIEVKIDNDKFDDMCRFISKTFTRDENGESSILGPGLYGESSFYRSHEKYYAPKTCNVWTARALKKAGLPVIPAMAATAGNVLSQTKKSGRVLQKSSSGLKAAALRGNE